MLLFRKSNALLLPAYSRLPAVSFCRYATTALVYDTSTPVSGTTSPEDSTVKGRTAGEMGDAAAQSMQEFMKGAEGTVINAGGRVEPKVSRGFVTKSDAVPSVDNPGPVVGISSDIMGDMMDALWAAFRGDHKKVAADVVDMARCQNIHVHTSYRIRPPRTTAQDWPRGSIADPTVAQARMKSDEAGPD